jgi:membrane fusion protein (multidrug efflux system)
LAPAAGVVTKKFTDVGQYVQPGQTLMLVVPLDDTWLVANFKETQLTRMRPGQSAMVWVDAYPGVEFEGRVDSIAAGTGARFSLLPPENATGNWVKVVQRLPVKIVLESRTDDRVLRPGMNSTVKVRVGR